MAEASHEIRLEDIRMALEHLSDELKGYHVVPSDYQTKGVESLADSMAAARAYGERAAFIHARSQALLGQAKAMAQEIADYYQDDYDSAVTKLSGRYGNLSWDERASYYRLQCLNTLGAHRFAQRQMLLIEGFVAQIDTLARSLYRARGDISSLADILKFGERLGGN